MTTNSILRTEDCLKLLADGPVELPDTHRAVIYLIANKHLHAITSTLVNPGGPPRQPGGEERPIVRRWELLPNYTPERVQGLRVAGGVEASNIRAHAKAADWPKALASIEEPIIRDAAADRLRGWW